VIGTFTLAAYGYFGTPGKVFDFQNDQRPGLVGLSVLGSNVETRFRYLSRRRRVCVLSDDCRNIARILKSLAEKGCVFKINGQLQIRS